MWSAEVLLQGCPPLHWEDAVSLGVGTVAVGSGTSTLGSFPGSWGFSAPHGPFSCDSKSQVLLINTLVS